MYPSEYGLIINDGKTIVPWEDYLSVIDDSKLRDKVRKVIQDRVSFARTQLYGEVNLERLNQIAKSIGLKDQSGKTLKQVVNAIVNKLEKFAPKQMVNNE